MGDPVKVIDSSNQRECVVEERIWACGVEIVSRVNYSQLARVRSFQGLMPDQLGGTAEWWGPIRRRLPSRRRSVETVALVR